MNILIVDDEQPARQRLQQLIDDIGGHRVVGQAATGEEALSMALACKPDVVLLDIRMPGMSGVETAHHLNALEAPPAVVFTTAYDEYAIEAFDARAVGYVLKPVRARRLERALEQASRMSGSQLYTLAAAGNDHERRKHVCARIRDELRLIAIDDVTHFVADQKYVCVYHKGGRDLIDESLKSLEEEFSDRFVRIHRGALVRTDMIDRLEKLADGKTRAMLRETVNAEDSDLTVSRRHLPDVRRRLKEG